MVRFPLATLALLSVLVVLAPAADAGLVPAGVPFALIETGDAASDLHTPVVVENPDDDQLLFLWHQSASSDRYTLVGGATTFDAFPSAVAFPIAVDDSVANTRHVAAAYNDRADRFLVVWEQAGVGAPGAYEIWGRLLERDYSAVAPPFRISTMGTDDLDPSFDAGSPTVAANDADEDFVVAWHGDDDGGGGTDGTFAIFARRVGADGTLSGSGRDRISASFSSTEPSIAFDDFHREYVVVYEGSTSAASAFSSIYFNRLAVDGTPADGGLYTDTVIGFGPATELASAQRNPDLAYDSRNDRFLVAWDEFRFQIGQEVLIRSRLLDITQDPFTHPLVRVSEPASGADALRVTRDPSVAYSFGSDGFVVAWSGSPSVSMPFGLEIRAREVDRDGTPQGLPETISATAATGDATQEAVSPSIVGSRQDGLLVTAWSSSALGIGNFGVRARFLSLDVATSTPDDRRPDRLALRAAPNPFNPSTTISFDLPRDGRAAIAIHDVRGARVRTLVDETLVAGTHARVWDGRDDRGRSVGSGVYFARVVHAAGAVERKLVLVK